MYKEIWYVKRTSNSTPEQVVLFYENEIFANATYYRAKKANDASILFGKDFPKVVASAWQ
jgi:hypothetical protein